MLDPRRKRQLLLFLGNAASGIVTVVVTFLGLMWSDKKGPLAPILAFAFAPALAITIWRSDLIMRGRERDLAKRVVWQVFWILIAWEGVLIAFMGFFLFFAFSAMAPVPHSHDTAGVLALIVIPVAFVLALWFTWVRSRRMLDLLWPQPGMAQRGSESPYQQLKL
jgi:magnesium-transporting ATPase (P-type)